jgi:hypothetical protein
MMGLRTPLALIAATFAFALAPASAQKPDYDTGAKPMADFVQSGAGGERITSFDSDVSIAADATLHVTETIRIHSLGIAIRHGFTRDFPTR